MAKSTVTWVQNMQLVATDSSKHSVVLSAQDEANGTGMKPSDLLLVSLAGCTALDVVNILHKKKKQLVHVQVDVEGTQQDSPPWPFTHVHLHYVIVGHNVSERDVVKAIQLSHDKYCSVSATLKPGVELSHDYEVIAPENFQMR